MPSTSKIITLSIIGPKRMAHTTFTELTLLVTASNSQEKHYILQGEHQTKLTSVNLMMVAKVKECVGMTELILSMVKKVQLRERLERKTRQRLIRAK